MARKKSGGGLGGGKKSRVGRGRLRLHLSTQHPRKPTAEQQPGGEEERKRKRKRKCGKGKGKKSERRRYRSLRHCLVN